jgi:RNA-directed DNA polymerase
VIAPLLANVYLHYVFDLWADAWRRKAATGDLIIVRYADDLVMGFQHRTSKQRMVAKLKSIKVELLHRKHDRISQVGAWLRKVVSGYYQYHAVPGDIGQLRTFRQRINRLWRNVLVRRSQRAKKKWESLTPVFNTWIPIPRILHPYPYARFNATHPS